MTSFTDTHVLTVDTNAIHEFDTGNPAALYSMWTVFSKCPDAIKQGRRLENFFWRLWQRETFIVDNEEKTHPATQTPPQTFHSESKISDVPALSSSVETLADEEAVDSTSVSVPLGIDRPHIRSQDSCASARSKSERHISSDDFEKMMVFILKDNGPLVPPALKRSGSDTDISKSSTKPITASESSPEPPPQSLPRTTVVRGFSPSQNPTPHTIPGAAQSSDAIPEPESLPVSSEQDQSLSNSKPKIDDDTAVGSDTDDYIDESAIDDDDDSSDWEDSMEESGESSMGDKFFQRVDSKANLTSRRSLITLMLAQNDRVRTLGNHASQSTSAITRPPMANDPSLGASPNDANEALLVMKGMRGPGLKPNTSHEVAKLKQSPEKPYMKESEDVNASSWNQYFSKEASDGYHYKGW